MTSYIYHLSLLLKSMNGRLVRHATEAPPLRQSPSRDQQPSDLCFFSLRAVVRKNYRPSVVAHRQSASRDQQPSDRSFPRCERWSATIAKSDRPAPLAAALTNSQSPAKPQASSTGSQSPAKFDRLPPPPAALGRRGGDPVCGPAARVPGGGRGQDARRSHDGVPAAAACTSPATFHQSVSSNPAMFEPLCDTLGVCTVELYLFYASCA
ncbi:hypothetical protein PVAP13_5KG239800 [Panicum virgatum]|uniref:Uncharacterized protein n=1 Tax=Panicum virgatum TaxID=38727 RepID=A0A8T0SMH7_PANVG|nr:hypothetical protein PVAP13_5KG239800 [Panicum virgatum]